MHEPLVIFSALALLPMDRQVRVFFGGPFAGSLISQPAGYGARGCQGIGFKKTVSPTDIPKLCITFK